MNRYYFTHVTSRSLKLDSSFRWVSNISFLTKNHFCEIQVFLTRCSTLSKSLFFHGCPTTEIWTEKRRKRERERKRERRREGGRRAGNLQRELSRFCEMRRKHVFLSLVVVAVAGVNNSWKNKFAVDGLPDGANSARGKNLLPPKLRSTSSRNFSSYLGAISF